jgi:O-antigen/teichoic acid export membrane protein
MEMTEAKVNSLRSQIVKGTVSGFIIQIGFAGLSFATATILARLLGIEGYGAYSNAIAWVLILSALGMFGFNTLLQRDMSILKAQENWALMKGLLRFSDGLILSISVFLALILWGLAGFLFSTPEQENLRFSLRIAAPLIPFYSLVNLRQSSMRGLQQVTRAMLPDLIIRPGLTIACIIGVYLFFPDRINAQIIIALSIMVAMVDLIISFRWLQNTLPDGLRTIQPQYQIKEWFKTAPPMFVIGGTQILFAHAPTILLGMLANAKNIGLFTVASRVANLIIFLPLAVGVVMGPMIARLYSQGKKVRLQRIIKKLNRLTFVFTFLLGLLFNIFAKNILSIFGQEFQIAHKALVFLVIGYIVDSGFGMSIITLMMTGHERIVAVYQAVFVVLLVILCFLFIPSRGYESVALAFMLVMITSRFTFALLAKYKTGINTTIF